MTAFTLIILTFIIASIFHGLTGIGVTLIATTALASSYPMSHVLVLTVIPCLLINLVVFLDGGRIVYYLKKYWLLVLTSFVGSFIGTKLVFIIASHHLLIALGLLIVGYVAMQFVAMSVGKNFNLPNTTPSLVISGTIAGVLGGATNAMSPLLVMYLLSATEYTDDPKTELIKASNLCYVVGKIAQLIVLWQALTALPKNDWLMIGVASVASVMFLYLGFYFRDKISQAMFKKNRACHFADIGRAGVNKGIWGVICVCKHMLTKLCDFCVFSYRPTFDIIDFFPNPDFCGFLKTSTPILIRVYF